MDEILRFVRNNPNCTKADVIRHMKGRSSINTTHYILLTLIDNGKLNVNKINIQTHLLTINEKDEFMKFHKMLVDLDKLVNDMNGFILGSRLNQRDAKIRNLFVGLEGIENSYRQSFNVISQELFNRINSTASIRPFHPILNQILHTIDSKLSFCNWDKRTSNQILEFSAKNIEQRIKAYNKQVKVKTNVGDKLIKALEDFKKEIF